MTMLYRLDSPATLISRHFGVSAGADPWERGYITPGSFAPVITNGREFIAGARPLRVLPRRLVPRCWGVPPPRNADAGHTVTAMRNLASPFWISSLRNPEFRCLVPATEFMESGTLNLDGTRARWRIAVSDQPLFGLPACGRTAKCRASPFSPARRLTRCARNRVRRCRSFCPPIPARITYG